MSSLSASALGRGTDETGEYWEDASGVKHYYLFQLKADNLSTKEKRWSVNYNVYSRADTGNSDAKKSWVNGSIFTLEKDTVYNYQTAEYVKGINFYGIELETVNGGTSAASRYLRFDCAKTLTLGEYGINSVAGNTLQFLYSGTGEKLHLSASQTWSGPEAENLSAAPFVIIPNYPYQRHYCGHVGAEDDVVLTVAGDLVVAWHVYDHALTNMDMVIKAPAVVSLPKASYGTGNLHMRKITIDGGVGIKFGADKSIVPITGSDNNATGGAQTYGIGSYPEISPVHLAQSVILTNGATLTALEKTPVFGGVKIVSGGAKTNFFSGTFELQDDASVFRVEEGSTLDLSQATFLGVGRVSLEGSGNIIINCSGGDMGGYLYLSDAALAGFDGMITVAGGTLVLESVKSIQSLSGLSTEGDGCVLLVDDTDFDPSVQLGGTKAVGEPSRLVVTDKDVSGEVSVANKEILYVFGDGLGANASVKLWSGATVMFRRSAEISAPMWYTNTVYFKTCDASVTGKVASAVSLSETPSAVVAKLRISSPGLVDFSGSGHFDEIVMDSGNAAVTGDYDVYGSQSFYGGHLTVRDGGCVEVRNTWQNLNLNLNTDMDACLEIASGGYYEIVAGNCHARIGAAGSYESKLLISGGKYVHKYDQFNLFAGGVVEVAAGTFLTRRRITCNDSATAERSKVVLGNGIFHIAGNNDYAPVMFDGTGSCTVLVDGRATLNCTGIVVMPDCADDTESVPCTWRCTEGSRLKVVGVDFGHATVKFHNFHADGLVFDLNTGDWNDKHMEVQIVDPADPLSVGFLLPGKEGSKITAVGTSPNLAVTYVVPDVQVFDTAELPSGWYDGFSDVAVSNLVFETGSTLAFPFFGDAEPLAISGTLTLPEAMNYSVRALGPRVTAKNVPVITAGAGVEGGETVFSRLGSARPSVLTLSAVEDALKFSFEASGAAIKVR